MSRWLIAALVTAIVIAGGIWWWTQRGANLETAVATRGSLDVTIQTVGTIQATGARAVRPVVSGVIAEVGVKAGDTVQQGDVIALLDRAPFDNALSNAHSTLTQAEYALQEAEGRAAASPDDTGLKLDALGATQRVRDAQRAVDAAQRALDSSAILAPTEGQIIELSVNIGDPINQQQTIARIASPSDLRLVADVDELDLPNVEINADVTFRLDAFPDRELTGTVQSTAPQARMQGGATIFSTTITYEPPGDLDIRPGMNADVTIVTARRENVLIIPERALQTIGERSFVTVRVNGKNESREVILGFRSAGQVEVVQGLSDNDVVVLP